MVERLLNTSVRTKLERAFMSALTLAALYNPKVLSGSNNDTNLDKDKIELRDPECIPDAKSQVVMITLDPNQSIYDMANTFGMTVGEFIERSNIENVPLDEGSEVCIKTGKDFKASPGNINSLSRTFPIPLPRNIQDPLGTSEDLPDRSDQQKSSALPPILAKELGEEPRGLQDQKYNLPIANTPILPVFTPQDRDRGLIASTPRPTESVLQKTPNLTRHDSAVYTPTPTPKPTRPVTATAHVTQTPERVAPKIPTPTPTLKVTESSTKTNVTKTVINNGWSGYIATPEAPIVKKSTPTPAKKVLTPLPTREATKTPLADTTQDTIPSNSIKNGVDPIKNIITVPQPMEMIMPTIKDSQKMNEQPAVKASINHKDLTSGSLNQQREILIKNLSAEEKMLREKYIGKGYQKVEDMPDDLREFYQKWVKKIAATYDIPYQLIEMTHYAERMGHGIAPMEGAVSSAYAVGSGQITVRNWLGNWNMNQTGLRFETNPSVKLPEGSANDFDRDGIRNVYSFADNTAATAINIRNYGLTNPKWKNLSAQKRIEWIMNYLCTYNSGKQCKSAPKETQLYWQVGLKWIQKQYPTLFK